MNRHSLSIIGRIALVIVLVILSLPLATDAQAGDSQLQTVTAVPRLNLRMRAGPGTNFTQLGLVPGGTSLAVLGRNEAASWILVEYRGVRGWLAAWYCNISGNLNSVPVASGTSVPTPPPAGTPSPTGVTATPPRYNLRLRSGPGTTYARIGLIVAGQRVQVLGRNEASNWVYVDYNGTRGWAYASYLTISGSLSSVPVVDASGNPSGGTPPGTATPPPATGPVTARTTGYLRFRSGPGVGYAQITVLPPGTTATVEGRNAESTWLYITFNGTKGWISKAYTTITGDLNSVPVVDPGGQATTTPPPSPPPSPSPSPSPTPPPPPAGPVTAAPTVNLRLRSGPGTTYPQIAIVPTGVSVPVEGRNADSTWVYVNYNGTKGWMSKAYTTISGDLNSVPVTQAPGTTPTVTTTPPPATTLPPTTTGFELGGQTHTLSRPDIMRSASMTWVKFQFKWSPGSDPNSVAGLINLGHANGFRVLISAPGPSYPSSIDYAGYVAFLRGVAALGADAIEVWNEMNLDREWPRGQISPASYVTNMLAPAYREIKAANPNTIVISGALAPTGVNIPGEVMSDDIYLAGMRDAGAASYMDCVGVHHNAGATSPSATTGHPADGGGGHYSWYYGPTVNLYAGIFPTRPVCLTEIGYLTSHGYGPLPPMFTWAGNTDINEHAQWLGEAVRLARASGRVRLFIVFNVDFTVYTDDPQAGYAILRKDGACPACATLAAAMR
jgi:uncharacterized protein YraI